MKNQRYIIKSNHNNKFIRTMYSYARPGFTPKKELITDKAIFNSIAEAEAVINDILKGYKRDIKEAKLKMKKINTSSWQYNHYANLKSKAKKGIEKGFTVESYIPEFAFNKKRMAKIRQWELSSGMKVFCHGCGSNIVEAPYYHIGQTKLCAFCIKELAENAQKVIEGKKLQDKDYQTNYEANVFMGSL